jgi:hypothetical protein
VALRFCLLLRFIKIFNSFCGNFLKNVTWEHGERGEIYHLVLNLMVIINEAMNIGVCNSQWIV